MSNIAPIWPGSASFDVSGSSSTASDGPTPFALYDMDPAFQQEAPRIANWVAKRLGYPVQNVELLPVNIFACFEEAVSEYSAQVNQWNIRNNLDLLKGRSQTHSDDLSSRNVQGSAIQNTIKMAEAYGTLAGVGGKTDIHRGYIDLTPGVQQYDLQELLKHEDGTDITSGERIDIFKVYYEETPAISRFFDPYSVSGQGTLNLIDEFGFGSFSPASQFLLMPIFEDLLRMQAIEFNDQIRKSAHTFNIVNNKISVFPIPTKYQKMWFDFFYRGEFIDQSTYVSDIPGDGEIGEVSDYSNINYKNIKYSRINDVGRQWIRKYTLALSKELMGSIRGKYSNIPIPGSEISLDGPELRSEGQAEREQLIAELRENLEDLSRSRQSELRAQEAQNTQDVLRTIPNLIYIG